MYFLTINFDILYMHCTYHCVNINVPLYILNIPTILYTCIYKQMSLDITVVLFHVYQTVIVYTYTCYGFVFVSYTNFTIEMLSIIKQSVKSKHLPLSCLLCTIYFRWTFSNFWTFSADLLTVSYCFFFVWAEILSGTHLGEHS